MKNISLLLLLLISSNIFAGAAEDLSMSLYDQGMRQRNGITISKVAANDGKVTFDASQEIIQGGSKFKIQQKNITLNAANDAFYNKTAGLAKNLLKGGVYAAAAAVAMDQMLKGVDYVMGEGGQIQKPNPETVDPKNSNSWEYIYYANNYNLPVSYSVDAFCRQFGGGWVGHATEFRCIHPTSSTTIAVSRYKNTRYDPSTAPPKTISVSDPEINTAFSNWIKNNPKSVTDPVVTYIYSPKDPKTGSPVPQTTSDHPSFGPNEITDEMIKNYVNNYHDRLAREQNKEDTIQKPQTETITDPASDSTTITHNPDGSTTTTTTSTKLNPDTGKLETVKTETTVMPDGTTKTKTEETVQTAPKPEVTDLPLVCEYFAFLCEWTEWTKKDEIPEPDPDSELTQITDIPVAPTDTFSFSGQCPAPFVHDIPNPFGGSNRIEFEYTTFCTWLAKLKPWSIAIAHLIGLSMLFGRGQNV